MKNSMKKIFLFIAFLWISLVSFAQDGVNFEHLSFWEALDKAKSEQKYVFMVVILPGVGLVRI